MEIISKEGESKLKMTKNKKIFHMETKSMIVKVDLTLNNK